MDLPPQWTFHSLLIFSLIYLTFFLDNVLITVLVPIIPDWVHGGPVPSWSGLGQLLNGTGTETSFEADEGVGSVVSGLVLCCRALCQLLSAPLWTRAVRARGGAAVLTAGTMLLATSAISVSSMSYSPVFSLCGRLSSASSRAVTAGAARALQGGGGAAAAVGGLSHARELPEAALRAVPTATAIGVLVGYPFGGIAYKMWGQGTPFLIIALVLLIDLGLQIKYLAREDYNRPIPSSPSSSTSSLPSSSPPLIVAGSLFLSAAVLYALEPCLPLWVTTRFHPERWALGVIFVPDSIGYLSGTLLASLFPPPPPPVSASPPLSPAMTSPLMTSLATPRYSAPAAMVIIGLATLVIPYAKSLKQLAVPQFVVGLGVGWIDGLIVPLLVRGWGSAGAGVGAAGAGAAGVLGPAAGGVAGAGAGIHALLNGAACLHMIYAVLLYDALSQNEDKLLQSPV